MRVASKTVDRARKLRWPLTRCETILWTRLRRDQLNGLHFRKQHPVGPYIADFACVKARLLIEIDGETHWTVEQRRRDARRTAFLEADGWAILRVWNAEVYGNENGVVDMILEWALARMGAQGMVVQQPSKLNTRV
jgi:very-short-patch-repair endonuclease